MENGRKQGVLVENSSISVLFSLPAEGFIL
jgi:hypothetical protein